jgi:hypothetical protein
LAGLVNSGSISSSDEMSIISPRSDDTWEEDVAARRDRIFARSATPPEKSSTNAGSKGALVSIIEELVPNPVEGWAGGIAREVRGRFTSRESLRAFPTGRGRGREDVEENLIDVEDKAARFEVNEEILDSSVRCGSAVNDSIVESPAAPADGLVVNWDICREEASLTKVLYGDKPTGLGLRTWVAMTASFALLREL